MSLIGQPLLWTLGILTVVVPCLVVFFWSRIKLPSWIRVPTHLAMIAGSQAVALMFVAVAVNDYGYFYSSWGDVFNGPTVQVSPNADSGSVPRLNAKLPGGGKITSQSYDAYSTPSQWSKIGSVSSITITGATSTLKSHAFVFLPPQYFRAKYRHTKFPAAEVFTGYPGNDTGLLARFQYPQVLLHAMAQHRAKPIILVMMRPSVTFPRDTECTDVPAGPQAETFFAQDVTRLISEHYRATPTGWGAIGDSTGGYCAVKFAMKYPSIFRAGVALSGYYFSLKDSSTGDLWGGSLLLRNMNDLEWRLKHMPAPSVSLLLTSSKEEKGHGGYSDLKRFLSLVKRPLAVSTIIEPRGGHNFGTWGLETPAAMRWLCSHLYAGNTT